LVLLHTVTLTSPSICIKEEEEEEEEEEEGKGPNFLLHCKNSLHTFTYILENNFNKALKIRQYSLGQPNIKPSSAYNDKSSFITSTINIYKE
jgi:hypothetical protein